MGILFNDAQNEYLEIDSTPVTTPGFTVAASFRSDSNSAVQHLVTIPHKTSGNSNWRLLLRGDIGGDPIQFVAQGTPFSAAQSTSGYSVGTWHRALGIELARDSRAVYLDGGNKGVNTDARDLPEVPDRISIGRAGDSSPDGYMSGDIAEVMIWNVVLTDGTGGTPDEVVADAAGALVRPESLVRWWMLNHEGDLVDVIGGSVLTAFSDGAGPVSAEHAYRIRPGAMVMPELIEVAVGATPWLYLNYSARIIGVNQ